MTRRCGSTSDQLSCADPECHPIQGVESVYRHTSAATPERAARNDRRLFSPMLRSALDARLEVACKQWNQLPADGFAFSAWSYDNTVELCASTWRHVPLLSVLALREQDEGRLTWMFSSDVCKHCERAGCLEAVPPGRSSHRVRLCLYPAGYLQWMWILHLGCPFGVVDRADRWPGVEVHPLLRPSARRHDPGRGGLSDAIDPVRRFRSFTSGRRSGSPCCTSVA